MKRKKIGRAIVIQDEENPVETNVLAQALVDISSAMKKLSSGGLNREAIVTLTHASVNVKYPTTRPNKTQIRAALSSLENLRDRYCK